jgi:predicted lipoprotein with Yx(FWY)xxD motif
VVPEKRKLAVVGAAIAVAFVLPGCAPAGVNAADYGNAAEPVADTAEATPGATADPAATSDPNAAADPDATAPPGSEDAAEGGDLTTELNAAAVKRMGKTVQNQDGFVLYRFDKDGDNPAKSNCNDDCEKIWPPAFTKDGEKPTLKGVDAKLVGVVTRADGSKQLTLKGWPLYTYIGDTKPGQWKGQNVGGTWFVIQPDGKKNLTCLPAISKPVAPPADGAEEKEGGSAGSDYSY